MLAATAILGTTPAPASAEPVPGSVTQCNGIQNVGGQGIECDVTVTNTLDVSTGVSSSTIVVRTCIGAANDAVLCTVLPTSFPTATTVVDQCNGSGNGGGGTVVCRVTVVNNIIGDTTLATATVNQCGDSAGDGGGDPALNCAPVQLTTSATITQCNSSGRGGGTPGRVTCTVAPSTASTALPVSINQCIGSANGGGAFVTCSASLTHTVYPAGTVVPPVGTPTPTPTPTPGPTTPPATTPPGTTPPGTTPPATTPPATTTPPTSTPPTPTPTSPVSPLLPVPPGGGTGNGGELAATGTDAVPVFLVAGGALLIGGILLAIMLLGRRSDRSDGRNTLAERPTPLG
ncbi:hypothetical protein [Cryobacterium sp. PAMC25264]|uniref:hypothetical protein n=1 Tax=Cryobacterium sp. PAMC25264 TaxID=2861288 RepID=UPI001C6375C5|nr:hypothetical protein [Cryobacterium sp. PAMC25264]QYF74242.1 hypothetical protein KY500_03185 [Cryobacterium sp. PAMC25264]